MFVKGLMLPKEQLVKVSPKDTIGSALKLIEENNFLSIPVAEGDKFYGSISKDRIYAFYFEHCPDKENYLSDFTVEKVMRTDIPEIAPFEQMETAAHFLEINNIQFLAVKENGKFLGIVTHHAIFKEFTDVFGLNRGKRLSVVAYDVPGQIAKLTGLVAKEGGDIISCVVVNPKSLLDVKEIVLRVKTDEYTKLVEKIEETGFRVQK